MNKQTGIIIAIALILIAGLTIYASMQEQKPGEYDAFAQCLEDEGATFYGAFWCPHCQSQKKLFGRSDDKLPYVECSTPNGQGQLPVCQEAGIESYPTWEFSDGERITGEVSLKRLAQKTGCSLPGEETPSLPEAPATTEQPATDESTTSPAT